MSRDAAGPGLRRRARALAAALSIAFALQLGAAAAGAHTRSLSYSTWTLDATGAGVRSRVSRLDLTRLGLDPVGSSEDAAVAAGLVAHSLQLASGDSPCAARALPALLPAPEGWLVFGWRVDCASSGPRRLSSSLLLEVAPSHLHFVRLELADGRVLDRVLSEAEPSFRLDPEAAAPGTAGAPGATSPGGAARYFGLGVQHILSGWDHLAFVFALLLLAASLRELALLVSAFTLAHSLTLALATTRWITARPEPVEALIGFSIALAAAENAWILGGRDRAVPVAACLLLLLLAAAGSPALPRSALLGLGLFTACHFALLARARRPAPLRAAIAFAFGLVHGMGFAGVLSELALPGERLALAMLGFNLGVEAGQLCAVALAWPALRALARVSVGGRSLEAPAAALASSAVCGLGVFWFATRALG